MTLSRRDVLKLIGAGMLSLALAELFRQDALAEAPVTFQGRTTISGVPVYEAPSFQSRQIRLIGKDQILELHAQLTGEGAHNRLWYRTAEGYIHSAEIQPVRTVFQTPVLSLPRPRLLGEVTVPFSDTRRAPSPYARRAYRVYYGSTHWVTGVIGNEQDGSTWYQIYDFYLKESFYLDATHLRLLPDEELAPLSPDVPSALKGIYVDLAAQYLLAFEDDRLVLQTPCATGAGRTRTPGGRFTTYHKGPSIHMTNQGDAKVGIYDLPGVPWVSFFTGTGIALHGTYWHNDFGKPRSHGCVNLPNSAARFLYRWTMPVVPPEAHYLHRPGEGTRVHVV